MRLIYLASPYSDDSEKVRDERITATTKALGHYTRTCPGVFLYSPILHWWHVAKYENLPNSFQFWKERDFFMIRKASMLWVLTIPGWDKSYGISQEIEFAKDIDKPIQYVIKLEGKFVLTDARPTDPLVPTP